MSLFQHTILSKYIAANAEKISAAYQLFVAHFHNPKIQEIIRSCKEEEYKAEFLRDLFVKVFGYTLKPELNFNLIREKKNETNSKKADGAILEDGEVVGVIELKDTKTTDLKNIETQAFGYKNYNKKAVYVITSNFEKLRFYIDNAIDYEEFNLFTLSEEKFAVLWLCLAYENIAKNLAKHLKTESVGKEEQITRQLYKDYSAFKRALFDDIRENNKGLQPLVNHLALFKKTQKLLDRLLFILFAEDSGLLPPNSIMEIVKQWEQLKEFDAYTPLYSRLKLYFGYMNTGRKGVKHDIFAYNGGLFAPDEVLNSIVISDEILLTHLKKVSNYDFSSEVDVNILGHIFENSLSEIEEIASPLAPLQNGEGSPKGRGEVSKRKKDGVFYTPRYITAYIVESTIGKLCTDKKAELEIVETEYFADKKRPTAIRKKLNDKLETYRSWLLSLTICDPACGSGAFLNAALDFLMAEHRLIDEMTAKLTGSSIVFPNIENAILENNLYGVDINDESVEIAKLALWLRTAKPNRKLNSLNNNIKCGNSLISPSSPPSPLSSPRPSDTPLQIGEGTGVRTVEVQLPSQLLANARELRKNQMEAEEFLWQILRGRQLNNLKFRRQHPLKAGFILDFYCAEAKLGIELDGGYHNTTEQQEIDEERTKIINEYGINIIRFTNEDVLEDTENTLKKIAAASTPPSPIWRGAGGEEEKAFNWHAEFPQVFEKGGFDVVIGNPPYVRLESIREESEKLSTQNYQTYDKRGDLYALFVERGFSILKESGYISYIMPNKWLQAGYGKVLREYFLSKELIQLIDFGDIQIFEGATTYPCIFIAKNDKPKSEISISVLQANNVDDFYSNVAQTAEIFKTEQFSAETWVVSSQKDSQLLERLKNENITLENFINGQSYRGVLTGLTEAFLIDEETKKQLIDEDRNAEKLIKPFLLGRDVKAYTSGSNENYLLLVPKGFTKSLSNDIDTENLAWDYFRTNFPAVANHLLNYKVKAEKRTDKGDYYWELRACDYYEKFVIPKIMYQAFQVKPCFIFDESGLFCNNSMWFIPTESKALLAVLNSIMGWWLISKYCTQIQNGYQLIWKYFGQIPIPKVLTADLETLAEKMLSLNSDLQTKRQRFLKRLSDNFAGIKITGKIETFDELEFAQFLSELAKQKITLTLKQQDEWEEYFNEYQTECRNFVNQINATDKEIDGMVYGLYGLTEEEIGIIEK